MVSGFFGSYIMQYKMVLMLNTFLMESYFEQGNLSALVN
jgi:hypothetical protein